MIALGQWGAFQRPPAIFLLPVVFPLVMMAFGGALGILDAPFPHVETGIAISAIGLDSPPEVVDLRIATAMLIGTGLGAIMVVTMIVAGVAWLRRDWQRIAVRVAGSCTAAAAILVLALRLAK